MAVYNTYKVHKSDQEIFRHFEVKNQLFVFYHCPQMKRVMQLYNTFNQFVFSLEGSRTLHKGDQTWEINKDTAFIIKRTAYHQELNDETEGWKVLALYVKDDYFKKILDELRPYLNWENVPKQPDDMLMYINLNDRIRNCYFSMLPYFDEDPNYPEDIIEMKFKELLYNIFQHPLNKHILAYVNAISEGYKTPIWEVMEDNFMFNLKLKEFADIANRSLSAFKREFKDYYRMTPGKWLVSRRLDLTKSQLVTTQKNIQEIAFDCGFNNASHFSRVFKEHFNITPSQFKNSLTA